MSTSYGYTPKVLLIEQSRMAQLIAKFYLVSMDCQVDMVTCGEKALEACSSKCYDLILSSTQLNDFTASTFITLLRELPNQKKDLPIIALSDGETEKEQFNLKNAGYNEVIEKPLSEGVCEEIVRTYLAGLDGSEALLS